MVCFYDNAVYFIFLYPLIACYAIWHEEQINKKLQHELNEAKDLIKHLQKNA